LSSFAPAQRDVAVFIIATNTVVIATTTMVVDVESRSGIISSSVDNDGLGKRLRRFRGERGLGLREVAESAGVNHGYLSQLERGEVTQPAPAILQKLANGYGIPFVVLMEWAGYIESGLSANQQRALSYLGSDVSDEELRLVRAFLDAIRKERAGFSVLARLDSELPDAEIERIRRYVLALLREADAADVVPTPIDQVMQVARLVSTNEVILNPEERRTLRRRFGDLVDRVLSRLQGVIHFGAREIWINPDMYPLRQRFVLGHEVGHYVLPEHREVFAYLDDERRLRADIYDLFERQANQASIELLAQGDRLRREADDSQLTMAAVDLLAKRYAISMQATARRLVEATKQECALAVSYRNDTAGPLTPPHLYCSASFEQRFQWKATGSATRLISRTVAAARRNEVLEPTIVTDIHGRAATFEIDPVTTPRAILVLFRPQAERRRLIGRLNSLHRIRPQANLRIL
jgi:transcriptional regulator with XRE-family HTH domain